jgi:hypothetical protein
MAEPTPDPCCAPIEQVACCEPAEKADCCGQEAGCGCDAGATATVALPMAPGCSLEASQLAAQAMRYRRAGAGARVREHTARRIVVDLDADVEEALVAELIAVEQGCCPFFELGWEPAGRRLSVAVSKAEDERALAALALAFGVRAAEPATPPS